MSDDLHTQLMSAADALEAQRALLGDAVVDTALQLIHERLLLLQERPEPAAQQRLRRQVSVLFLDVVNSTQLAQQLDPEEVQQLLDTLLRECTRLVRAFGGRVLQYAGDSLLAAFGTEGAREDDAERAVRCGLALCEQGLVLAATAQRLHGFAGSQVRVGIHTGPVLLGGGLEEAGTIRGQAVNIAARMEQNAPPGALRISHDTWQLVRGLFDAQAQAPLRVKGVAQPMRSYLVRAALEQPALGATRDVEGVSTPMLGREAEWQRLLALAEHTIHQRGFVMVTVVAGPGLGKTRLLQELQAHLEQLGQQATPVWLLLARAHPQARLQPFGLLRGLLAWRLQIADSASAEQAREKLVGGLQPFFDAQGLAKAHRIGQLIGIDFQHSEHVQGLTPQELRRLGLAAFTEYLQTLTQGGASVACLVEDLHWADDDSLDYLQHLATRPEPLALLVLATSRPQLLERRPGWAEPATANGSLPAPGQAQGTAPQQQLVRLGDLSEDAAQQLVATLLARAGDAGLPLQAFVRRRAAGNPYFIEELVRMLLDQGVLQAAGEAWRVNLAALNESRAPTTLVGVLQARLDLLTLPQRQALQQASIVGTVFWDAALAALDPQAPAAVPALQQRELVHSRPSSAFEGTAEESFHHQLMQQVAYDTVLLAARRAGHAAAAAWLAERVADRPAEYLAITAEHYDRAGDSVQALRYFKDAAVEAQKRYAKSIERSYLERAMANPAATSAEERLWLLKRLTTLADHTGDRALQDSCLQQRLALADQNDDDDLRVDTWVEQALLLSRRGDEQAALALAQRVLDAGRLTPGSESLALAHGQMAWSLYVKGDLDAARSHAQGGLEAARQALGDTEMGRSQQAQGMTMLLMIEQASGDLEKALATAQDIDALTRGAGLRRARVTALRIAAVLHQALGQYTEAAAALQESLRICIDIQLVLIEALCEFSLASVALAEGDAYQAEHWLQRAQPHFFATQDEGMQARCLLLHGRVRMVQQRPAEAEALLLQALQRYQARDERYWVLQCEAWLSALALQGGQLAAAQARVERIAQQLSASAAPPEIDEPEFPAWVCWQCWQAEGDARAAPQLEQLHVGVLARLAKLRSPLLQQTMRDNVALVRDVLAAWRAHGPQV